jgi:hypothetical protein
VDFSAEAQLGGTPSGTNGNQPREPPVPAASQEGSDEEAATASAVPEGVVPESGKMAA